MLLLKMIVLFTALAFFSEVYMTQTDGVLQANPLLEGLLRGNVTLKCTFSKDETDYIFWYKQSLGRKPHVILKSHLALGVLYNFNPKHYKVQARQGNNHLIILSAEPSDSALYYCGILKDSGILFGAGTFLMIKDSEELQSNSRTVVQQPVSDPVHPGDSVTLNCTVDRETCAGEHSVYWFRHGSGESLPGLIYTHGNRSDECEKSPEAGSPTHSCVYSLPKRNFSHSDAGTYYCAVVTCGDILFGNGTKLDIEEPAVNVLVFGLGTALTVCVIGNICILVWNRKKKCCEHCSALISQQVQHDDLSVEVSRVQNNDLNYAALHFADAEPTSGRKKRELKDKSVYSHVRYTDWETNAVTPD